MIYWSMYYFFITGRSVQVFELEPTLCGFAQEVNMHLLFVVHAGTVFVWVLVCNQATMVSICETHLFSKLSPQCHFYAKVSKNHSIDVRPLTGIVEDDQVFFDSYFRHI